MYVPEAVLAGACGELAFEELVADGVALGCLLEQFEHAFERGDLGDAVADDLVCGEAEGLGLAIVDAEVAEFDGVEEGEADGGGLVDGFEFGALALGLELLLLELFGVGFAVVDVDGDAEPVEDIAGVVADGESAEPPPADGAVAGADHAGFDVVLGAGGDGVGPGFDDARMILL